MSAKYTRLGQLKGKFGVSVREYLTARDFGGNFYLKHCKIETVFIFRSAKAGKLKKTYI